MKCPYREHIHINKTARGYTHRSVEWEECYKNECPFYKKDERHNKPEMCLRPFREE